ncbi:nucleoside hydrolase [Bifidobacterium asteroides]|nr:nucleoside hydrolase [Bifidobacterium asteroides]MCP8614833.1 nucleoside hydrolase [Bifidobacterium asteroides]
MMTKKVLIDTDPGVGIPGTDADDPIALLFALADPRLELLAVTSTFGNCPPWLTARGARKVLDTAGRADIPVAQGIPLPLKGRLADELITAYQGERGKVGKIDLPELPGTSSAVQYPTAPVQIIKTVEEHPGEVSIIALGPQTNLATALLMRPDIAKDIPEIIFMGGALGINATYGRGNITPVAECNMYFDPLAANIVMNSGIPLRMISLDVTNPETGTILRSESIREINPAASPVNKLFHDICATYLENPMFDWGDGCILYDPLAVASAADPSLGTFKEMAIVVETDGRYSTGQTIALSEGKPNVKVMIDVDGTRAVDEIVRQIESI